MIRECCLAKGAMECFVTEIVGKLDKWRTPEEPRAHTRY